jgi:hypothetical protein
MNHLLRIASLLLFAACAASPRPGPVATPVDLALVNVNVVDVEHGRVIAGRTVLIAGNRITHIGAGGDVRLLEVATTIDGTGHYLIPGLVDMHAHLFNNVSRRDPNTWAFPLFVANGVLGVREPWTEPASMATVHEWRREVSSGTLLAPRVLAAGALVEGPGSWMPACPRSRRLRTDAVSSVRPPPRDSTS